MSRNYVRTTTSLSEQDEELCVDIFRNIMRARHCLHGLAAAVAAESGLHVAEMNVIDILGKSGPVSMGRLSSESFISASNTTNTVKKLEQAGFVVRKRAVHSDREVTVALTAEGKSLFRRCYPRILQQAHEFMSEGLTRSDLRALAGVLGKLLK